MGRRKDQTVKKLNTNKDTEGAGGGGGGGRAAADRGST